MFVKQGAKLFVLAIVISLIIPVFFGKPISYKISSTLAQDIDRNDAKRPIFIGVNVRGSIQASSLKDTPSLYFLRITMMTASV